MNKNELDDVISTYGDNIKINYDLKKNSWFNIGGKAEVFYKADNLPDLIKLIHTLNNKKKIFVLGAGSNTLISDNLFRGVVIKLNNNFGNISLLDEDIIIAGASALDRSLSKFAIDHELSGFEFLSCIPGTVGGGIKMNAGCFGREIKDILLSIQVLDYFGNVRTIMKKDINFSYRSNNLPDDLIFLSASFKGIKGKKKDIEKLTNYLKTKKEKNQPTRVKTCGSTFKNPIKQTNKKVWELIQYSIPQQKCIGGACISEKHRNFLINKNNASFKDMKNLIEYIEKTVFKKTGIKIEKEIKILE